MTRINLCGPVIKYKCCYSSRIKAIKKANTVRLNDTPPPQCLYPGPCALAEDTADKETTTSYYFNRCAGFINFISRAVNGSSRPNSIWLLIVNFNPMQRQASVINGTAEFLRDDKHLSVVSACDGYGFNNNNQIQNTTSYCIQSK